MAERSAKYGSKRPTNVSINAALLREAKNLGINLSATLENALDEEVRKRRRAQWLEDNADAIDAYNEHVEKHGVFSDGRRLF